MEEDDDDGGGDDDNNDDDITKDRHFKIYKVPQDRLCGLVVRVSGYRYRGLGFDSRP